MGKEDEARFKGGLRKIIRELGRVNSVVGRVVDSTMIEKQNIDYIISSIYITKRRPFWSKDIKWKSTIHAKYVSYKLKLLNRCGSQTLHTPITASFHYSLTMPLKI